MRQILSIVEIFVKVGTDRVRPFVFVRSKSSATSGWGCFPGVVPCERKRQRNSPGNESLDLSADGSFVESGEVIGEAEGGKSEGYCLQAEDYQMEMSADI